MSVALALVWASPASAEIDPRARALMQSGRFAEAAAVLEAAFDGPDAGEAIITAAELRSYAFHHAHALDHLATYARRIGRPPPPDKAAVIERPAKIHTRPISFTVPPDVLASAGGAAALTLRAPDRPPLSAPIAPDGPTIRALDLETWTVALEHPYLELPDARFDVTEAASFPLSPTPRASQQPGDLRRTLPRVLEDWRAERYGAVVDALRPLAGEHPDAAFAQWLLGTAAHRTRQWAIAVDAFERLAGADAARGSYADALTEARAALGAAAVVTTFDSDPPGATVSLLRDGVPSALGVTPLEHPLAPGTYTIAMTAPGYTRWRGEVDVLQGAPETVAATLVPISTGAEPVPWTGVAGVVVGVGLSGVAVWQAIDLDRQYGWWSSAGRHVSEHAARREQYRTTRTRMWASLAGGVLSSALGTWLLLDGSDDEEAP